MAIALQLLKELEDGTIRSEAAVRFLEEHGALFDEAQLIRARGLIAALEAREIKERKRSAPTLRDLIPPGWLADYLTYAQAGEAPDSFHFFCALAYLTQALGHRMFYPMGHFVVYPQISSFLVGPSGTGKSVAANAAKRIGISAGLAVLHGRFSPEALQSYISKHPHLVVYTDEAGIVLNRSDYNASMPQILCDMLNGTSSEVVLRSESFVIPEGARNLLIACTAEQMAQFPKIAAGGGFLSRMLMIVETDKARSIPRPSDVEGGIDYDALMRMEADLARRLEEIGEQAPGGRVRFDEEAGKMYDQFARDTDRDRKRTEEALAPYFQRRPSYVTKLSMAILASQLKEQVIDAETIQCSMAILKLVENKMNRIYQEVGLEKTGRDALRVLSLIEKEGGRIDRSTLITKLGMSKRDLDEVTDALFQSGKLSCAMRRPGRRGMITFYELVKEEGDD